MKHSRFIPFALACLIAPAAFAEDISGKWSFATENIAKQCTLVGEITFTPKRQAGAYSCEFTSVYTCRTPGASRYTVRQTCTASTAGKSVSITSAVDSIIEVSPPAPALPKGVAAYYPDNFVVTYDGARAELRGKFYSFDSADVRFWRKKDLVS